MLAACLGLVWHYARRRDTHDFLHSPAFGGTVAVLLICATVPLSNSRSCTVLVALLLGAAFLHWIVRIVRRRRQLRESVALPVLGAVATLAIACGGVWYVARDSIMTRFAKTQEQIADMRARGGVGDRATLYRNTWKMAQDKPWFGWGMASYPHVFTLYNTQTSVDRLPVFYHDAHSDWLQAFAEHGFVGSALLGLLAAVPLLRLRRRHFGSPVPAYLLFGCGLIVLYAWLEFPFGNLAVVFCWWLCFFGAIQYARLQDRESPPSAKPAASPA
jgi:O-antigen ligase